LVDVHQPDGVEMFRRIAKIASFGDESLHNR